MPIKSFILVLFLFFSCLPALAANVFVGDHDTHAGYNSGGSGDGSDWNNTLDDLPAALNRGDTYYIGDGSYAAYTFDDTESSTSLITVKKATPLDHGAETGWDSSYGDGQAVLGSRSQQRQGCRKHRRRG